jgi:hypothetical protein
MRRKSWQGFCEGGSPDVSGESTKTVKENCCVYSAISRRLQARLVFQSKMVELTLPRPAYIFKRITTRAFGFDIAKISL